MALLFLNTCISEPSCLENYIWNYDSSRNSSLINPLPNEKFLGMTSLKASADDKLNVTKITIFLFDRVETLWEKKKMLVTSIFCFSHSVFQGLLLYGC